MSEAVTSSEEVEAERSRTPKHNHPEWLEKQYIEEGLSLRQIAKKTDVGYSTIRRRMIEHNIPLKDARRHSQPQYPTPRSNSHGHVHIDHKHRGSRWRVMIHRLHATLIVDDISELEGMEIHHKNGCTFDNREENYEIMDSKDHKRETQKMAKLPPYKGLCRECGGVTYIYDKERSHYCSACGSEYDSGEVVETQHIDWGEVYR